MKHVDRVTLLRGISRFLQLAAGVALTSFAYAVFQVPFNIAPGGVGGLGVVVSHYTGISVGLLYLLLNIPLLVLGFFNLGRWPFVLRTLLVVAVFSYLTDFFLAIIPRLVMQFPLTDDVLLSTIYGGIVGGIGAGLLYRSGATDGGTSILGRVIQLRTGMPLSQVFLWTDGLIVVTMGLVFGWEISLYALLALFLYGMASDYVLEGPRSIRTVSIITDRRDEMTRAIISELGRGVSMWPIQGGYTGETHWVVFCTVHRPQVNDIKRIVAGVDKDAFVTIAEGHQALGKGFSPLR